MPTRQNVVAGRKRRDHVGCTCLNGNVSRPDPVQLSGVGMNVDQRGGVPHRVQHLISAGGDIAQPGAQRDNQVGVLQPRHQLGVRPDIQVADIGGRVIVDVVLPPERDRDGQAVPIRPNGQIICRLS